MPAWAAEATGFVGHAFFAAFASVQASIAVALLSVAVLVWKGFHRTGDGLINARRIGLVVTKSFAIYSFSVCVIFHFFFKIPVSEVIGEGFGNDRFAWIFFGLIMEQSLYLWNEYRSGHE